MDASTPPKLRLMCSYGGRIVQHPSKRSLLYAGGDTRIVAIPASTANNLSLPSLTAHLSTALKITSPFTLKYLLPNDPLDSLISISTEDDLLIMLDEHRHNREPPRIRLFLFPAEKLSPAQLKHPKTESWFVDTLKSAKFMQGERSSNGSNNSNNGFCEAESMLLETSSSFGSASSSVSKGLGDDVNVPALEDNNKVKLSSPESIPSDNSVTPAVCHQHSGGSQGPDHPVVAKANIVSSNPFLSDDKTPGPSVLVDKMVDVPRSPLPLQFSQPQQLQYVPAGAFNYTPQNPTGVVPMSSYYVMNFQVPQQQLYCHTNQSQTVYLVPAGQPYNCPVQSCLINVETASSNSPALHPTYFNPGQAPMPATASQVHQTVPMSNPLANVHACEFHQQGGVLPRINPQAQSIGVTSLETANCGNELDDDSEHALIYKSQPPPPHSQLPPHFQTMSKGETFLASDTYGAVTRG